MTTLKYFTEDEFACKCGCGRNKTPLWFMEILDSARAMAGIPFEINSGYRCPTNNTIAGGSPTSSHLKGWAVDIKAANSVDRFKIVHALLALGVRRIGIADTFVHADVDANKTKDVMWVY